MKNQCLYQSFQGHTVLSSGVRLPRYGVVIISYFAELWGSVGSLGKTVDHILKREFPFSTKAASG